VVTGRTANTRAAPTAKHRLPIGYPEILHGADGDSCRCGGQERPGIGTSPGAGAADQITPEPPEERQPAARGTIPVRLAAGRDRGQVEPAAGAHERAAETGRKARDHGQGGWYRGAAAGVPRPSANAVRGDPGPRADPREAALP